MFVNHNIIVFMYKKYNDIRAKEHFNKRRIKNVSKKINNTSLQISGQAGYHKKTGVGYPVSGPSYRAADIH